MCLNLFLGKLYFISAHECKYRLLLLPKLGSRFILNQAPAYTSQTESVAYQKHLLWVGQGKRKKHKARESFPALKQAS